nr:hypothetical protein [Runella aurantiaca]
MSHQFFDSGGRYFFSVESGSKSMTGRVSGQVLVNTYQLRDFFKGRDLPASTLYLYDCQSE